ncbi:MAG: alpha/beta fold hydrolase [Actinomycetota bacterium]|nr:alpha/beta fold hydrolase [Actinomycetota bacterium]
MADRHPASRDYAYGDHPSQIVRLWLPEGGDRLPVVLVIHGGFWRQRYGLELAKPLCRNLICYGVAAAAVEYRRVGRPFDASSRGRVSDVSGGGWPMTLIDIARAVDSLDTLGQLMARGRLDCSRVVAVGHSAGGQLAAWLAHRGALRAGLPGAVEPGGDEHLPILGAVCQAPVLDLVAAADQHTGGTAVVDLLGGSPGSVAQRYRHASPISYVGDGARLCLVHGTEDDEVPIEQSRRYLAGALDAGDPVELVELEGIGHYEHLDPQHSAWAVCRDRALQLLR